ncbi:putative Coiled-coil domain-containing protein, partial [Naja naja]
MKQSNSGYVCSEVSFPDSSGLLAGIVTTIPDWDCSYSETLETCVTQGRIGSVAQFSIQMAPAEDIGHIEICKELDRVILHLFDALEMLQTKREAFNGMVEQ